MEWYLVYTEKDKSLSIIDRRAIISAGDKSQMKFLKLKDNVTFMYGGNPYIGVILGMSDSRSEIDELAKAEAARMKRERRDNVDSVSAAPGNKRKSQPPSKYSAECRDGAPALKKSSTPSIKRVPMPEDESSRKRILALNQGRANKAMNESIMKIVKDTNDDDPIYSPDSDSNDSGDSSSSEINDFVKDSIRRKEERIQFVKNAKTPVASSSKAASVTSASPTKEELQRQLEEYKLKLQAVYDRNESGHKTTPSSDAEDDFETFLNGEDTTINTNENRNKVCEKKKEEHEEKHKKPDRGEDKQNRKRADSDQEEENNSNVKNQRKIHEQADQDGDNDGEKSSNGKKDKVKKNSNEDDLNDGNTYEYLSYQLNGNQKNSVHLMNGIYCDARELTSAIQASKEMSHMVRRLMVGVFNAEKILECTFTGRKPTAAGADAFKDKKVDPLHPGAIFAIIKYAKAAAKSRKWTVLKKNELHTVFTQKLGEMKRAFKKNAKAVN